ncbi:MAG TPA: PAS domain S-box protein, partial [Planctomycetota bacterium]|nr:PAS domain S-box protein [Planctomycetota bacterium]
MKFRLIPVSLGLLVGLCVLALVGLVDHLQQEVRVETARAALQRQLGATRARLESNLNSCLFESQGLVTYIANHPQITTAEFIPFAKALTGGPPPINVVSLARGSIFTEMYPTAGSDQVLGRDLLKITAQREAVQRAIDTHKPVVTLVDLLEGGRAFIARIPVYRVAPEPIGGAGVANPASAEYWGMVNLLIPPETLLAKAGLNEPGDTLEYALQAADGAPSGSRLLYGDVRVWQHEPVVVDVEVPGGAWRLAAVPADHWHAEGSGYSWLRVGGFLLAVLAGVLVAMRASEPQRLHEAVTEATSALRESEEKFRHLYENSPDFIALVNEQGLIQLLNRAAAKIPRDQLIGRSIYEFTPPEDIPRMRDNLARVFQAGELVTVDQQSNTSDGQQRWFRNRVTPIRRDGKVIAAMFISTEITDTIQRERALKESEERFRRAFAESPLGLVMLDLNYRILSANAAFCALLGYSEAEITRVTLAEVSPPEEYEQDKINIQKALEGVVPVTRRVKRYLAKDGRSVWCNLNGTVMRDPAGKPMYLLGMLEDITSRRQAEQALQAAESRNRAMLHAIPDILQRVHRDGTYLDFAPGSEETRFVDAKTAVGRNVRDFFPPDISKRFMKIVEDTLASGTPQQFEIKLAKDGRPLDYDVRVVVCAQDEVLVLVRNITVQQRSRDILRNLVEATSHKTGEDFVLALVRSLAGMLQVRFAFISEFIDPAGEQMRMTALWADDKFVPVFDYPRAGTPCENLTGPDTVALVPRGLREAYPKAERLRQLGAESY